MKKLDLHVHTLASAKDASFTFSMAALEKYVTDAGLDAIAVTNHDMFDLEQFKEIQAKLDVVVFPGIEVSLDCGHLLVIAEPDESDDFSQKAEQVASSIPGPEDGISPQQLEDIFGDLRRYVVIPHCAKKPAVVGDALDQMVGYISAGEVDSPKKFIRAIKNPAAPTPVLFSDVRVSDELEELPTRQTYVDCGELTVAALKACLKDKGKVALSRADGNQLVQIFDDGQMISTGLNVLLGERSSGKTFTLNRLSSLFDNVKYIKQFSLVQQDSKTDEREFNQSLERKQSQFTEQYLSEFKVVLNDIIAVDLEANDRAVENYLDTLLKSAKEADRQDAYSKTALFDESAFPLGDDKVLSDLIGSVRQLIENVKHREIISRYVDRTSLQKLACELIELLWSNAEETKKKKLVNGLVADIRAKLKIRTSAVQVSDVDLYSVSLDSKKVARFTQIVRSLQTEATISDESIQGFRVVATKAPFAGAGEVKTASGVVATFRDAFSRYGTPYDYLQELLCIEQLKPSELYKLFTKISYSILNRDGFEVSGGERSEFRLLQEINDAQNFDFLLIDEPESSFDNLFLKSGVNEIIKELSRSMPVVVVTHNNTVGASIHPDYVLYASKELEAGAVKYRLYSGHPTDHQLESRDGRKVSNSDVMLNSLEAGRDAYADRRQGYEAIED